MNGAHPATAGMAPYLEGLLRSATGRGRYVYPLAPGPGLRKGVVNRILYYRGSFNPPHAGHLASLKHVVKHCGEDYNVVAIVVEMTHDEDLWLKFRGQPDALLLTSHQRLLYWEEALLRDADLRHRCWGIGGYDFCGWRSGFEGLVRESMARSEFDVRVVHLAGGDYIRPDAYSMERFRGPTDYIISDISRQVEFQDAQERMFTLAGCEPWEKIFGIHQGAGVWSCRKRDHPAYTVRFVSAKEPMNPNPSSTAVQRAIKTSKPEALDENLRRSGALSHHLLAKQIGDRKEEKETRKKRAAEYAAYGNSMISYLCSIRNW
ncbi:hypothetical protein PG985_005976 [Apiospora marii]|uniref:Cytidyltransferase-like domain-containing protein n=1 Tax=Apiospora marii TaxID=335849 RepID=A0ABR1S6B5_9PEZI